MQTRTLSFNVSAFSQLQIIDGSRRHRSSTLFATLVQKVHLDLKGFRRMYDTYYVRKTCSVEELFKGAKY